MTPWLFGFAALFVAGGWGFGLFFAPTDFQQGDAYRILFVHVPAAWLSLFVYSLMASCAVAGIVWRAKMAAVIAVAAAPLGAAFTFLALATGAIWGRPMWGAWWVWDARLTSELILLFLYLGFVALYASLPDKRAAWRAGAILLVVGFVNVPVVHYSVEWWSSLHQPASVMRIRQTGDAPDDARAAVGERDRRLAVFFSLRCLFSRRRRFCAPRRVAIGRAPPPARPNRARVEMMESIAIALQMGGYGGYVWASYALAAAVVAAILLAARRAKKNALGAIDVRDK